MGQIEFGERVRAARVTASLSVREGARACGLAKSHFERLEAGRVASPSVATVDALARGLRVDRSVLLRAAGYL